MLESPGLPPTSPTKECVYCLILSDSSEEDTDVDAVIQNLMGAQAEPNKEDNTDDLESLQEFKIPVKDKVFFRFTH